MNYRPASNWKSFRGEPEVESTQLNLKRSGEGVEAMIPPICRHSLGGWNNECVLQGVALARRRLAPTCSWWDGRAKVCAVRRLSGS
jgi:hypothetical protein